MTLREHLEAIAGAPRARDGCLCGDCIVERNQEHAVAALANLGDSRHSSFPDHALVYDPERKS